MKIGMEHLQKNMEYQVKVRAIPQETYLQGTWSEWSESYSFVIPAGKSNPLSRVFLIGST